MHDIDQSAEFRGLRLLVVEDEMVLAMSLEELLTVLGCRVVKAARLRTALELVESEALDGALVDINLAGETVYPVATALERHAIPFVFMTGYDASVVEAQWRGRPVLEKPFVLEEL